MGVGCICGTAVAIAAATFLLASINLCQDHLWINPSTVMEALEGQKVTDVVFLQSKGSTIGTPNCQVHSNLLPLLVLRDLWDNKVNLKLTMFQNILLFSPLWKKVLNNLEHVEQQLAIVTLIYGEE